MTKKSFIIVFLFFIFFFTAISPVFSTESLLPAESSSCDCSVKEVSKACMKTCGTYSLNDMVGVAVRITDIILALTGSVALLMFIYGGVVFLISGGSPEKVKQGKQIITNSVIGILIIFSSFIIIQFSMDALGYTKAEPFGEWNQSK